MKKLIQHTGKNKANQQISGLYYVHRFLLGYGGSQKERLTVCWVSWKFKEGEKRVDSRIPKVTQTHTAQKVKLFEAINFVKCLASDIKRASKQGLLKKGAKMGMTGHREVGSSQIP